MLANWNLLSMLSALVGYVANACVHGKGARVHRTMRTMRACVFFPRVLFFPKAFRAKRFHIFLTMCFLSIFLIFLNCFFFCWHLQFDFDRFLGSIHKKFPQLVVWSCCYCLFCFCFLFCYFPFAADVYM